MTFGRTVPRKGTKACNDCCACCKNWCHTCGMRKCRVQRDTKWGDGTLLTEYQKEYWRKQADRDPRGQPDWPGKQYVDSVGRFNPNTTHRMDYPPKSASHDPRARPAAATLPYRPFDDSTTYNAFYDPKRGIQNDPRAQVNAPYSAPFIGLSTYNGDYVPRPLSVRRAARDNAVPAYLPFDGSSTYRDDFYRKQRLEPDPLVAAPLLPSKNDPNHTTYGIDYVPKPFDKRAPPCCDDARHPAETMKRAPCTDRPWTSCTSCAGDRTAADAPLPSPGTPKRAAARTQQLQAGSLTAPSSPVRGPRLRSSVAA